VVTGGIANAIAASKPMVLMGRGSTFEAGIWCRVAPRQESYCTGFAFDQNPTMKFKEQQNRAMMSNKEVENWDTGRQSRLC